MDFASPAVCHRYRAKGIVRFYGKHMSDPKKGVVYGIELDRPVGRNNGTVSQFDRWPLYPPGSLNIAIIAWVPTSLSLLTSLGTFGQP